MTDKSRLQAPSAVRLDKTINILSCYFEGEKVNEMQANDSLRANGRAGLQRRQIIVRGERRGKSRLPLFPYIKSALRLVFCRASQFMSVER